MPNRRVHEQFTKSLLGDGFPEVHTAIDAPSQQYPGFAHRQFNHGPISAQRVGCQAAVNEGKSCFGGAMAGLTHIIRDYPIQTGLIVGVSALWLWNWHYQRRRQEQERQRFEGGSDPGLN